LLAIRAMRSVRHTAARPSRASPPPTGISPILWERACSRFRRYGQSGTPRRSHRGQARLPQALSRFCGSGLARDSGDMVSQAHRGAAIAGKPGSHRHCADFVGAGLLAIRAIWSVRHTAARPSRASPTPTGIAPILWERACSRFRRCGQSGTPRRGHRGQARLPQALRRPCGSGLARDSGDMVSQAHRGAAIVGKPGSHRHCADFVGAGLLAIRAMRSIRHTAAQPSRASPAPTGIAPTLWERACSRFGRCGQSGTPRRGHRGQARLPPLPSTSCGRSGLPQHMDIRIFVFPYVRIESHHAQSRRPVQMPV
jgi:hypothetical protein